jgi:hypothetical protein
MTQPHWMRTKPHFTSKNSRHESTGYHHNHQTTTFTLFCTFLALIVLEGGMELAPRLIPLVNEGQRQEGECCSTCKSMTGTLLGLEALVSTEGYIHHTRKEMKESAKSCPLCQLILPFCPFEPVIDKQVHIFAHLVRNRERKNLEQIQHPWRGGKVHYFFVNSRAPDHQLWPTFTIEGEQW